MSAVNRAMTLDAGVISSHLKVVPRIDLISSRCIVLEALRHAYAKMTSATEWVTTSNSVRNP